MNVFVYRDVFFELTVHGMLRLDGTFDTYRLIDEQGNTAREWYHLPALLQLREAADDHVKELVEGAVRAGGDVECSVCGKPYREHPEFRGALNFMEHPYLTRLCNGDLVKL